MKSHPLQNEVIKEHLTGASTRLAIIIRQRHESILIFRRYFLIHRLYEDNSLFWKIYLPLKGVYHRDLLVGILSKVL